MAQTALLALLAVLFFAVLVFLSQWIDSGSRAHSSTQLAYRGIKKTVINTFPVVNYSAKLKVPGLDTECLICLSEFEAGESVRILPKCNHGFHVHCIDKWLSLRSYCPKCRHCLIGTC